MTSAVAVPAYAGIPVTHRGVTQDFAVVSAHLDPSQPGATRGLGGAGPRPGTLVLLMAVAHLETISAELIKRGRAAATPVAVIRDGTLPRPAGADFHARARRRGSGQAARQAASGGGRRRRGRAP